MKIDANHIKVLIIDSIKTNNKELANAASKTLYALTGEVLVGREFVRV